jgi:hypothetical protein
MNLRICLWRIVALAGMALSQPLAAQSEKNSDISNVAETEELSTRFDPPLGKPLRYKVTQERIGASKEKTSDFIQEVAYRRDGEGYVMTLRPLSITSGDTTFDLTSAKSPVPPELAVFVMTMELDLDSDGAVVRMRDWDAMKLRIEASVPVLAAGVEQDPKKRPQFEAAMRQFFARYAAASAENAPSLMIKGWPDVLGVMGASGPAGETTTYETMVTTPFSLEPLRSEYTIRLTQPEGGANLRIDVTSAPDPEAFKKLVLSVLDTFAAAAPADKPIDRTEMERQLAAMNVTMKMTIDLDPQTGLVRYAVSEKHVGMTEGAAIIRLTIEAQ